MVQQKLTEYSAKTGTEAELDEARLAKPRRKGIAEKIRREISNTSRLKVSGTKNGENTIETVCQVIDNFLGDEFGQVLEGRKSKASLWNTAKKRVS